MFESTVRGTVMSEEEITEQLLYLFFFTLDFVTFFCSLHPNILLE